ncbi:hypothetical protein [Deinococcus koreensis]|uniref:Exo-alpha-sialidase n=1 Tax=Deinococcus koreensis TaxID=2054903 RepID=A0A2K3UVX9_9DEIO|nr:hypothetical protein [Deinococcus koreensis]PNY80687.1 hypothetical protein CVO96_04300 [Deinococcus koreensis]
MRNRAHWLALTLFGSLLLPAGEAGGAPGLSSPTGPDPVLAVAAGTDGRGNAVVAWVERTNRAGGHPAEQLHAARLRGLAWEPLGGVVNENAPFNAAKPTVHPGADGSVWLAWEEGSGLAHIDSYLMSNWQGGAWTSPTPYALRRNLSDAGRSRSFAASPDNRPLVGWTDIGTGSRRYPSVVSLRRWTGSGWQATPYLNLDLRRPAFMPSVAAVGGRVMVAYVEGATTQSDLWVRVWDGVRWQTVGGRLNVNPRTFIFLPRLRVDPAERPVVAWLEDLNGLDVLYVSRWNGQTWQRLGGPVSVPGQLASSASLGFDPQGRAVVAWNQGPDGARGVHAARWEAGRWLPLGGPLNADPRADTDHASLAAGPGGVLVAWRELEAGHWRLKVQRLE